MTSTRGRTGRRLLGVAIATVVLAAGCGDGADSTHPRGDGAVASTTVRLGYFPNLTHASAIVAVQRGLFAQALGANVLEPRLFNAGPDAVTALLSGALDAAYVGPNPAVNAYVRSKGAAVRIVSGATAGGALLVVQPGIDRADDLRGTKVASPQLGGTQDIALRTWLRDHGLATTPNGGGDVSVIPQPNAQTLQGFQSGALAGAWVPEPWATRLVQEGGGKVLVDERTRWPDGRFVTTHLVVSTRFLSSHPEAVRALVEGQVAADRFIAERPDEAKRIVNEAIAEHTGKGFAPSVIDAAWMNLTFTNDPIVRSLVASAASAEKLGLLERAELEGIYDLTILNGVLRAAGLAEVAP